MSRNQNNHLREAHAPYNFVPFPKQLIYRYNDYTQLPSHHAKNSQNNHLLSGKIQFEIEAVSPILVADGSSRDDKREGVREFVKNANNEYEIPGSTMRGLIRQTLSVLSLSNWASQIQDETFYYRAVAGNNHVRNAYRKILDISTESIKGKTVSIVRNVHAGYIVKMSNDQYVIYPARTDGGRHGKSYYKCHQKDFKELGRDISQGYKIVDASFTVNQHGKVGILKIGSRIQNNTSFVGKLVFSGPMRNKKTAYLINEINVDESKVIAIRDEELKAYKADYEFRCSKFGDSAKGRAQKEFFSLPEKIGIEHAKPCFYINYNNQLYFGFTAYLRLTYKNSTRKLIPKNLQEQVNQIDYESALFGFTNVGQDNDNYASRLSFLDAIEMKVTSKKQAQVILGQPRASALGMYLQQGASINSTYNDDTSELRGLKQYWVKKQPDSLQDNNNTKVMSKLELLDKGTVFLAEIRFNELYEDELGLLIWSIKEPAFQQIGMGKPYGYGVVKFNNIKVIEQKNVYDLQDFFKNKEREILSDDYIRKYKDYVQTNYKIDVDKDESIQTFFKMKQLTLLPTAKTRYMQLNDYRKMPVLPTVDQLLNPNNKRASTQPIQQQPKKPVTKSHNNRQNRRPKQNNTQSNRMTHKAFAGLDELFKKKGK